MNALRKSLVRVAALLGLVVAAILLTQSALWIRRPESGECTRQALVWLQILAVFLFAAALRTEKCLYPAGVSLVFASLLFSRLYSPKYLPVAYAFFISAVLLEAGAFAWERWKPGRRGAPLRIIATPAAFFGVVALVIYLIDFFPRATFALALPAWTLGAACFAFLAFSRKRSGYLDLTLLHPLGPILAWLFENGKGFEELGPLIAVLAVIYRLGADGIAHTRDGADESAEPFGPGEVASALDRHARLWQILLLVVYLPAMIVSITAAEGPMIVAIMLVLAGLWQAGKTGSLFDSGFAAVSIQVASWTYLRSVCNLAPPDCLAGAAVVAVFTSGMAWGLDVLRTSIRAGTFSVIAQVHLWVLALCVELAGPGILAPTERFTVFILVCVGFIACWLRDRRKVGPLDLSPELSMIAALYLFARIFPVGATAAGWDRTMQGFLLVFPAGIYLVALDVKSFLREHEKIFFRAAALGSWLFFMGLTWPDSSLAAWGNSLLVGVCAGRAWLSRRIEPVYQALFAAAVAYFCSLSALEITDMRMVLFGIPFAFAILLLDHVPVAESSDARPGAQGAAVLAVLMTVGLLAMAQEPELTRMILSCLGLAALFGTLSVMMKDRRLLAPAGIMAASAYYLFLYKIEATLFQAYTLPIFATLLILSLWDTFKRNEEPPFAAWREKFIAAFIVQFSAPLLRILATNDVTEGLVMGLSAFLLTFAGWQFRIRKLFASALITLALTIACEAVIHISFGRVPRSVWIGSVSVLLILMGFASERRIRNRLKGFWGEVKDSTGRIFEDWR